MSRRWRLPLRARFSQGGGIGLEPVYAADVLYKETSGNVTTAAKNGETDNTIINELTVGGVKIGSETDFTGISISGSSTNNHVTISDNGMVASGGVFANIIDSGLNARMSDGKVVAKNGLYIGYTGSDVTQATYDNSKFAVNGENGSFKAANGNFKVSDSGAIKADSLTLDENYNVKQNIEDAKTKITTVEGELNTNKANLTALQGKVDGHDTDINALKTTTQGITRVEGNSTTVEGVNFRDGAVSGVKSINGDIEFDKAGTNTKVWVNGAVAADGVAANNITANSSLTVGDATNYVHMSKEGIAVSGRLYSSLDHTAADLKSVSVAEMANTRDNTNKISYNDTEGTKIDSNVIINKGKKNQVKITEEEGIVVGLNSSVINDDGVFAGGHDYANAKAALNAIDGSIKGANGAFGVDKDGNVTTTGDIQGKDITATGALNGASLDVTGNAAVGGTLDVTGKTTLKNELQVNEKATFGIAAGSQTVIEGGNITAGGMLNSKSAKIGSVGIDNTGAITGVTSLTTDALTVTGAFTTGNLNVNGDLTASGAIHGKTISITDGGSIAGVNFATGGKLTATTGTIGGVSFETGGVVSGVKEFTSAQISDGQGTIITNGNVESKTAKIGAIRIDNETIEGSSAHGLSIEGVKIKDGVMSSVVSIDATKATIGGVNTLNDTGLTVKTGSKVQVGTNTVIEDGSVKVSNKTILIDQSLQLNDTNKWTQTGGLVADKATVNGIALGTDSKGKATFSDAAGNTTTIDGNKITTGTITADELNVDKISLGKGTDKNITIGSNGDVTTKGDVTVTGADDDTTVIDGAKATFGKNAANQTIIDKGTIKAKAKSTTSQIAEFGFDENGLTVSGQNAEGKTSYFSYNAKTGVNTFTGQDGTTTAINGSAITSTKATGNTGVLDGSNLTLKKGVHSTVMTAGGVTFTGKQGASTQHGDTTTIDGGIITTDTLKVQRIQLGEKIVDERTGKEIGSGVTLAADGGFTAAGGNFKVVGGATGSRGSITNVVGDDNSGKTVFETNQQGANMSFKKGGVTSNVSVGESKANVSAGNASIDVVNGSITDKVGGTTVKTKDGSFSVEGNTANGMKINTNTGETTFTGAAGEKGGNTTTINGGNITTDTLNVERINLGGEMVDKNGTSFGSNLSMDAKGNFSAAGGKFKVNGADGAMTNTVGKTSFATSDDGVNSSVTQDDTHKSEFNQGLTSIGGVVTNGEIKVAQKLDGATGLLTNEVTDANGSSKLVQNGTGLEYTDSAKLDNATRIDSSDVSIGSATDDSKRINLSDLGQIDELDKELTDRDEYKNNPTAVGGINAEAAIRREEVARLDGRINDVNDRVNKVGAMAAAIASLKSIGYDPQAPSEFSIGLGQYKGETGVAMGFFHYPNKNFMINVSLSTAGGETMGGIGATWRFGHKSPQKLLEEQREAQAKKELAAAEKYQAAAKLAKEAQERAEYAAKLARQAQVSADNAKAAADATQAKHFG